MKSIYSEEVLKIVLKAIEVELKEKYSFTEYDPKVIEIFKNLQALNIQWQTQIDLLNTHMNDTGKGNLECTFNISQTLKDVLR